VNKRTAICQYLKQYHTGMGNAVYSRELERLFSIDGRNLRRMISALRMEGYPICSGDTGYYFADNQAEINATINRLNELVTKVSNSRNGLLHSMLLPVMRLDVTIHIDENFRRNCRERSNSQ
jgi:uncharacterized protein YukE